MNVDVKLNLPREAINDIGNEVVRDLAESFRDRAEELVERFQSKALPRDTVREIVEHGQHSVLSVIDREDGRLVFSTSGTDGDPTAEYITVEMTGGLAQAFFANINT